MTLSRDDRTALGDQIARALRTHHEWMRMLREAADTASSPITPEVASDATACEIGMWLASGVSNALRAMALYGHTVVVHERFHREAGRALELALARDPAARLAFAAGGPFGSVSSELRHTLYEWLRQARL